MKDLKNWLNGGASKPDAASAADVERQMERLSSKSEEELLSELKSSFESGKADGSITPESIKTFTDTVAPMLTAEQMKKLSALIKNLS